MSVWYLGGVRRWAAWAWVWVWVWVWVWAWAGACEGVRDKFGQEVAR